MKYQQAFHDAIKELKAEGKADVDSYPEIEDEGMNNSFFMSPTITLGRILSTSLKLSSSWLAVRERVFRISGGDSSYSWVLVYALDQ